MKVRLARTAGFCMGVRRAMETVLAHANKTSEPIYTFGPLIHNSQVLELLKSKGIICVDTLDSLESGTVVIRAHGVPPATRLTIRKSGLNLVDATCPRVAKVQSIIRNQSRAGRTAVIAGDCDHAEVIGLLGYSETPAYVVNNLQEAESLSHLRKPFLVAQTTHNAESFLEMVTALRRRYPDIVVFDTICEATHERQEEVRLLASQVDGMVVVGGYHSGNTRRLAQISEECGVPTFHVETDADLKADSFSRMDVIGVTAGASTPNWMIRNVVKAVESVTSSRDFRAAEFIRNVSTAAVQSNFIGALGAAGLAHAASMLTPRPAIAAFPVLAGLYVFAIHISNRFLDRGARAYNDPNRAAFLSSHRRALFASGAAAAAAGMVIAGIVGPVTFLAFSLMILAGLLYSFPIFPACFRRIFPYAKIKDIPGSRSFSEALAWTAVIGILPLLETPGLNPLSETFAILMVFVLSYIRAVLFDVFQAQGDLIVGTETLPVILGETRTLKIIKWLIVFATVIFTALPLVGVVDYFSLFMLLPVFTVFMCVSIYEKRGTYPGTNLEVLVDGGLICLGLLSVFRQVLPW